MAVSDVLVREGRLDEAEDHAERALCLCWDHPWSERIYAQERIDNVGFLKRLKQALPPPLPTLPSRHSFHLALPPTLLAPQQVQPAPPQLRASPPLLSPLPQFRPQLLLQPQHYVHTSALAPQSHSPPTLGFGLPFGAPGGCGGVPKVAIARVTSTSTSPQARMPASRVIYPGAPASGSCSSVINRGSVPSVVVVAATPPTLQPPPPTPVSGSLDLQEISPFPDFLVAHLTLGPRLSPPGSPSNRRTVV
jgi:hypothetical protein